MSLDWILKRTIDWEPARKITPKDRGNRGLIPTVKNPLGSIGYESCIERDFYLLAVHCPSVKLVLHQPITLEYKDADGADRSYTPDAYLETTDGSKLLVEIKSEEELLNQGSKYEERWKHTKLQAEGNGIRFLVLTEKNIRTPRWFNVWFTLGSSKCYANKEYIKTLEMLIPATGIEYRALCHLLSDALTKSSSKAAQILCYAIYHGLVFIDTFSTKQISNSTLIQRRSGIRKYPFRPLIDELNSINQDLEKDNDIVDDALSHAPITRISPDFQYDEENSSLVSQREEMLSTWLKQTNRSEAWKKEFFDKWGIRKSQLYRYLKRYNKGGRNELFPKHKNAGRKVVMEDVLRDLMQEAKKLYFKPGCTQKRAYAHLVTACSSKKISPPSFKQFTYYISQNSSAADAAAKKGKKYLYANFTPSLKSFQGAILPLQIIQVDNSSCDVKVTDEENREALATPFLTASIDCYSGMITGLNISLFPSSSRSVLEVLVQTILPKDKYKSMYDAQNDWNIEGFPVVLLVDNGMDFGSEILKDFCKKYDIMIEFVPIKTPRYKAYIEHWFNVLKTAMKQEGIPGFIPTLQARIENPDIKPEKDATLTLPQIEAWIHKWTLDEYHLSNRYEGHVYAPHLRLQHALGGTTDMLLPSPREPPLRRHEVDALNLSVLEPVKKRLRRGGITWEYLFYHSKELGILFRNIGNVEVNILRDIRDVRHIWVINPTTNTFIEVGLGSGWAAALVETFGNRPIHETMWKRILPLVRKQLKSELTPLAYRKAVSQLQRAQLIDVSKKEKKSVRKDIEKSKETTRKAIQNRINAETVYPAKEVNQFSNPTGQLDDNDVYASYAPGASRKENPPVAEDDIYLTYKPKLLPSSKYPKKKLLGE